MALFDQSKEFEDVFDAGMGAFNSYSGVVDFTLLDPRTTTRDIEDLCNIAYKNKYYSVVVPPIFVEFARKYVDEKLSGALKVCSVVGFPLGNVTTKGKIAEAKKIIKSGADEIEVVINISAVKENDYRLIKSEMSRIVRLNRKILVKAILETAYLTMEEIEKVVKVLVKTRVDYIMTSTGYAPIGATEEIVEKLSNLTDRTNVQIKAAGGVKSKAQAENFIRLGASRIGTSRII